jgi:hypothetical protein
MAGQNVYVVSVLGKDIFWSGGDLTSDINSALPYNTFADAESGMSICQQTFARTFGPGGFEIRTMIFFR